MILRILIEELYEIESKNKNRWEEIETYITELIIFLEEIVLNGPMICNNPIFLE